MLYESFQYNWGFSGPFQGPALTVAFEGAVLTTSEVCVLLANPPAKLRGQLCQYGSGLLGAYHITELPFIVSSGFLYLFDPSGQVLAASLADGRGTSTVGSPVGKAYAVKGTFACFFSPSSLCRFVSQSGNGTGHQLTTCMSTVSLSPHPFHWSDYVFRPSKQFQL